jgi:Protein of unknown function (DUF3592)
LKQLGIDWRIVAGAAVLVVAAAAAILHNFFKKPEDPADEERRRRFQLNQVGRIVEGLVVEVVETPAQPPPPPSSGMFSRHAEASTQVAGSSMRRLVRYSYSISGITYETAQDVTGLEERLCLERIAAGQPASVKYDPSNPSNSILVADDWSGIH